MGFIVDSLLIPLTTVLIVVVTSLVVYFKYVAFNYWQKRGIPILAPTIPVGNIGNILMGKQCLGEQIQDFYKIFKRQGHKHAGIYFLNSPIYMPIDPDIIKLILIKDFQHFVDRGVYHNEKIEPLSAHLFAIEGTKWKNLRAKLSPTFTSGKMKMMFETLVDCSHGLKTVCDKAANNGDILEIKDILARFTTDIIGSCAFGLECNSLKNPDAEFRQMGKKIFDMNAWEAIRVFIGLSFPSLSHFLQLRMFNEKASNFFLNAVTHTIDYREKSNIKRNDFLQLLIQLKNEGTVEEDEDGKATKSNDGSGITVNEAAAQAFVFFLAGFETSSTLMTFFLYEVSINTDIQDKLREEVLRVLNESDGQITYDGLMKMTYMDKVIQETLRKYPPVPFLNRQCTTSYKVPNTDLVLEKGISIFIPLLGLQTDPEFFPNPDLFDPERFSDENKANRHSSVYMPFGEGPRICIGMRFGMMQAKVGLAVLLSRYIISLNEKTKLPITFGSKSIVLTTEGGVWLDIKKM